MVLKIIRAGIVATGLMLSSTLAPAQNPMASRPPRERPMLFGFALECTDCDAGMHGRVGGAGRGASTATGTSKTYPHVIAVAPGSAAERAGIRPGDELRAIDGLSLLSSQGAERLARAAAGEQVQLSFERNAKPILLSLRLGASSVAASGGTKETNTGYMAINGRLHGDLRLDFWTDETISTYADSATGTITFQVGTGTIIRMKYTKDPTDAANRPAAKRNELQWF